MNLVGDTYELRDIKDVSIAIGESMSSVDIASNYDHREPSKTKLPNISNKMALGAGSTEVDSDVRNSQALLSKVAKSSAKKEGAPQYQYDTTLDAFTYG